MGADRGGGDEPQGALTAQEEFGEVIPGRGLPGGYMGPSTAAHLGLAPRPAVSMTAPSAVTTSRFMQFSFIVPYLKVW